MHRAAIGRRTFLALSTGVLLRGQTGKGYTFSSPPQSFVDSATEFDLFRLTDPRFASSLPAPHLRFISRRGRFLIHSSDRGGSPQAYRLDWHTGESRQLTAAAALDTSSPALSPDDRSVFYFDGSSLRTLNLGTLREREVARVTEGWTRAPGFTLSADGQQAGWIERRDEVWRLQFLSQGRIAATIEGNAELTAPQMRPGHTQVLFRSGSGLKLGSVGRVAADLKLNSAGSIGQALWTPGGATLIYLSVPTDPRQLTTLREHNPDTGEDALVSKTSQFGSFGINGNASVFAGASRSLASPYVLLLLRAAQRELTLCEHRSSNAANVEPAFSPDSQNLFFTSDRQGKRAIYRAHVEKFVEETSDE